MKIQVFQGTDPQQFRTLQQEGKIFTAQPVTSDGRNVMTNLRNMRIPLQPVAQVVDEDGKVQGLSFATGNGVELSETGTGYVVSYSGQDIMTLKQSTEDGIGVSEMATLPSSEYSPPLSYPVEQATQPYQQEPPPQQPYQQSPYPPQPYQQGPYPPQPYVVNQPYQPNYGYQSGYDPGGFAAPMYPVPVPYVDYHENHHLLHHYYDHDREHEGGFGHALHDIMDHGEHHDDHHW